MRTEHLRIFFEVAQAKSMVTVSEKLFVTPQNISKVIKQLENELNTSLFERTKHGIFLTENGKFFYDQVKTIIEKMDIIINSFHVESPHLNDILTGSLNIMVSYQLAFLVYKFSIRITSNFPEIPILVLEVDGVNFYDILQKEKPELALLTLNMRDDREKIMSLTSEYDLYFCCEEFLHLYVNKSNQIINKQLFSLKDVATLPIVCFSSDKSKQSVSRKSIEDYGIALKAKYSGNSIEYCLDYLKKDLAVCIDTLSLSSNWNDRDKEQLEIMPLKQKIKLTNILFVSHKVTTEPLYNKFLNMIKDHFTDSFYKIL